MRDKQLDLAPIHNISSGIKRDMKLNDKREHSPYTDKLIDMLLKEAVRKEYC